MEFNYSHSHLNQWVLRRHNPHQTRQSHRAAHRPTSERSASGDSPTTAGLATMLALQCYKTILDTTGVPLEMFYLS